MSLLDQPLIRVTPESIPGFKSTNERFNVASGYRTVLVLHPSTGPGGGPVGYNASGDKVEYLVCDDEEDSVFLHENILRRNDRTILEAYDELWYRVWWLTRDRKDGYAGHAEPPRYGESAATGVLDSDDAFAQLLGRLEALAWVLGEDWERAGDT